jgi:hypothetical protein
MSWWLGELIVNGQLDFDSTANELWDQAARKEGVFSYDPYEMPRKDIGEWSVCSLEGRLILDNSVEKKKAMMAKNISVIPPSYNKEENFNVILREEGPARRLLDLVIDGRHIAIDINKNPAVWKYHMNIIPEPEKELTQSFNETALFAIQAIRKLSKSPRTHIGFHPWGGLASLNHLHLQLNYYEREMPIERSRKTLAFKAGDTGIFTIDYPANTVVCIELDEENKYSAALLSTVKLMQEKDIIHPISIIGGYAYIFVEKRASDKLKFMLNGIASLQLDGYACVVNMEDFNRITEKDIINDLEAGNIDREKFHDILKDIRRRLQVVTLDLSSSDDIAEVQKLAKRISIEYKDEESFNEDGGYLFGREKDGEYIITNFVPHRYLDETRDRNDYIEATEEDIRGAITTYVKGAIKLLGEYHNHSFVRLCNGQRPGSSGLDFKFRRETLKKKAIEIGGPDCIVEDPIGFVIEPKLDEDRFQEITKRHASEALKIYKPRIDEVMIYISLIHEDEIIVLEPLNIQDTIFKIDTTLENKVKKNEALKSL